MYFTLFDNVFYAFKKKKKAAQTKVMRMPEKDLRKYFDLYNFLLHN